MPKPSNATHPGYAQAYIDQVQEDELSEAFLAQEYVHHFFQSISEEQSNLAYAPGKWTIKELLQHIIDAERIFAYRALSFARKETQPLPGFEENDYADNSEANRRPWHLLCEEFAAVRRTSEFLFDSFTPEMLGYVGTSNNTSISVTAIGFILIGHVTHHVNILKERYLI